LQNVSNRYQRKVSAISPPTVPFNVPYPPQYSDIVAVAVEIAVEIDVQRLRDGRLQGSIVTQAVDAAKFVDLIPVNFFNLIEGQKDGFLFQSVQLRKGFRERLFRQTAKQPGMLGPGLGVSFLELLRRSGADRRGVCPLFLRNGGR
jgi:hypothetical protein